MELYCCALHTDPTICHNVYCALWTEVDWAHLHMYTHICTCTCKNSSLVQAFLHVHSEALLRATSAISIVTIKIALVALKRKLN